MNNKEVDTKQSIAELQTTIEGQKVAIKEHDERSEEMRALLLRRQDENGCLDEQLCEAHQENIRLLDVIGRLQTVSRSDEHSQSERSRTETTLTDREREQVQSRALSIAEQLVEHLQSTSEYVVRSCI